jgi:DNA-binding NarL/FixJ family response regulator
MPLSRREFQVLQLVAEGLENAAIAKILYLSVETVRTHVKSILRKLSARDRTHAVTIAFRSGILIIQTDDAPERVNPSPAPGLPEPRPS